MAPPKKGGIHGAEQAKERLTAVVMADSFTQRFQPVTVERPKVLLPLVNVPLLDYTLEWLSMNRIEECYVFCCAHADQIEAYLEANRRAGRHRKMRVMPIISTNCMSMGDALRFLDHKDILKTDFVLVSGDVITNVRLLHVLEAHRRRRAADKSAIMTLLMRGGVLAPQRARFGDIGTRIAMDPETGRLLKYEEDQYPWLPAAPVKPQRFRVDASLFSERDDIVVRTDLMISGIYICSPEVLMLFSDNFDYQNIRRDFVIGVLSEEELGNKLYVHEITKEYAARVHTLRSYDAISRDVLQRWTYPLVPDTNIFKAVTKLEGFRWQEQGSGNLDTGHEVTMYRYSLGGVYLDQGVTISRSATVANSSCIGSETYIADGAIVLQSVLGRGCHVGPGTVIQGSYLGDGVHIGCGVTITHSMLCSGVVVKDAAVIEPNTVLSFRVVVDRSVVVPSGSRISLTRQPKSFDGTIINSDDDVEVPQGVDGEEDADSDFDSDFDSPHSGAIGGPDPAIIAAAMSLAADGIPESNIDFANDLVGPMGAGFSWATAAWGSLAPPTKAVHDAEKEVECLDDAESDDGKGGGVEANLLAEDQVEEGEGHVAEPHFKREVAETFLRCIKEKISHENVVIELNGLKIAEDRTFADCARYMLTTALGLCLPPPHIIIDEYKGLYNAKDINSKTKEGRLELLRRATIQLRQWQDLLQKFVRGEEDQVELLLTLEEFCGEEGDFEETGERGADYVGIFPQLLKVLYDLDVVSEEALVAWAKEKEMAEEQEKQFLRLAQPFLDWLQEAEEESDEEDSDEE